MTHEPNKNLEGAEAELVDAAIRLISDMLADGIPTYAEMAKRAAVAVGETQAYELEPVLRNAWNALRTSKPELDEPVDFATVLKRRQLSTGGRDPSDGGPLRDNELRHESPAIGRNDLTKRQLRRLCAADNLIDKLMLEKPIRHRDLRRVGIESYGMTKRTRRQAAARFFERWETAEAYARAPKKRRRRPPTSGCTSHRLPNSRALYLYEECLNTTPAGVFNQIVFGTLDPLLNPPFFNYMCATWAVIAVAVYVIYSL